MRYIIPGTINIKKIIARLILLGLVSFLAFLLTKSVLVSVILFLILLFGFPFILRAKINQQYRKYLSKVASKYTGEVTEEIRELSIFGFVPFKDQVVPSFVYANENGILIRKFGVNWYLPWSQILHHENCDLMGRPAIKLLVDVQKEPEKLVLPWSLKFATSLPGNRGGS